MPIHFKNRLLFLHIPKCGGDTVTSFLASQHDPPFLFVADGSVMVNGHTPQHMTWREYLKAGWSTPDGFRVAALVRHPVDRVKSAYRYIHRYRPDLRPLAPDPKTFLDAFLSDDPAIKARFDHHNLGILDFIADMNGEFDPAIRIRPVSQMDLWLEDLGLPSIPTRERRNVTNDMTHLKPFDCWDVRRIVKHYRDDIDWYQDTFGTEG